MWWTSTHERIVKCNTDLKELGMRVLSLENSVPSPSLDSKTLLDVVSRLESLELRFANLHARLTETTATGKERLSPEGRHAQQQFLFGGPAPRI